MRLNDRRCAMRKGILLDREHSSWMAGIISGGVSRSPATEVEVSHVTDMDAYQVLHLHALEKQRERIFTEIYTEHSSKTSFGSVQSFIRSLRV